MGLTIHYELRLAGETSEATAVHHLQRLQRLQRLHDHALTLGAKHMCPVFTFNGAELSVPDEEWEGGSVPWLFHVCTNVIRTSRDGVIEDIENGDRLAAAGFVIGLLDEAKRIGFDVTVHDRRSVWGDARRSTAARGSSTLECDHRASRRRAARRHLAGAPRSG